MISVQVFPTQAAGASGQLASSGKQDVKGAEPWLYKMFTIMRKLSEQCTETVPSLQRICKSKVISK